MVSNSDWSKRGKLLSSEGKLSVLCVQETGVGLGFDQVPITSRVIIQLKDRPGNFYGFGIEMANPNSSSKAMIDILRDAFKKETKVRIEYLSSKRNEIVRVINLYK